MLKFLRKKKNTVTDESAELFMKVKAGDANEDDLAKFADWADEAPEKLDEIEEMAALWDKIGDVAPNPNLLRDPGKQQHGSGENSLAGWLQNWLGGSLIVQGSAVAVLLLIAVLSIFNSFQSDPISYATARGQTKQVVLADGSTLALNGLTGLDVAFESDNRTIRMDRGEVYFDVAPDKNKPFIVMVAAARVQAVGTAFNIERGGSALTVTVTEGIVDITLPEHIQHAVRTVRINAGTQIVIDNLAVGHENDRKGLDITKLTTEALAVTTSWRDGVVHFNGEPLSLAIEKLNRRASKRIIIGSDKLKSLKMYGTFDLDNIDSFLAAIEGLHGIRRSERDGAIYLFPKRPGK